MKKIQRNKLNSEAKHSLLVRCMTAAALIAIIVPCIIFGGWFYFGLIALIAILASIEITHITDLKGTLKIIIGIITIILTLSIIYYVLYAKYTETIPKQEFNTTGDFLADSLFEINISVMLITLMAAIYFIISFCNKDFTVKHAFYYISLIIVVSIGIQSFLCLRYSPFFYFANEGEMLSSEYLTSNEFAKGQSMFLLLYVLIGVIMNDTGAYLVGVLFGKHKMAERISPKKTWEGFLGGIVFSFISSIIFAVVVTYNDMPLLPIFDFRSTSNPYALFYIIGISVLLPLFADIGDFAFSAIKRFWGVKDFSNLLPGHGGVLDRVDSTIFAAALVSCLIIFIEFITKLTV